MNRYKKTKTILGEGSYKKVTKALDEEEGIEVAYNEVRIKNYEVDTKNGTSFSKEISILKSINHPNLLKILDYWYTEDDFIFITEFMTGGSVMEYIINNGSINSKLIKKWGNQIMQGLNYLHELNIIHRDIKNDNIFINSLTGEVKIGDLGLAKERHNKRYTMVGTPGFMAKEIFEGGGYTEKIDIYAFGMCLIEMTTGKTPYAECKDTSEIYRNVLSGGLPRAFHLVEDKCLKNLIMGCISEPDNRLTALEVLDHHFFKSEYFECDCSEKKTVEEVVHEDPVETILPLEREIELELPVMDGHIITFQMIMLRSMRYIKFNYDIRTDTVERVTEELASESIIGPEYIKGFAELLRVGIDKAMEQQIKLANYVKGSDEISESEIEKLCEIKTNYAGEEKLPERVMTYIPPPPQIKPEEEKPFFEVPQSGYLSDSDSYYTINFGLKTIEEMQIIEEEMKIHQIKLEMKAKMDELELGEKRAQEQRNNSKKTIVNPSSSVNSEYFSHVNFQQDTVHVADLDKTSPSLDSRNEKPKNYELSIDQANDEMGISSPRHTVDKNIRTNGDIKPGSNSSNISMSTAVTSPKFESVRIPLNNNNKLQYEESISTRNNDNKDARNYTSPLSKLTTLNDNNNVNTDTDIVSDYQVSPRSPPMNSFPSDVSIKSDDQSVDDLSTHYTDKYSQNHSITQFAMDVASFTGRSENVCKEWIKILKDEDISSVFDLKLLVYEDWEKIPLTVFSCRAMQNMLYTDGIPLREKQLISNSKIGDYDNNLSIKDFLISVSEHINRKDVANSWEHKLLAQDIQNVGELRSLHNDDWNRLGLSVYGYRILKNIIFKKGRIQLI